MANWRKKAIFCDFLHTVLQRSSNFVPRNLHESGLYY